jgi:hypothetical protein
LICRAFCEALGYKIGVNFGVPSRWCLSKSIEHVQEFADFFFIAGFGEARGKFHEDFLRNEAIQECHDNIKF